MMDYGYMPFGWIFMVLFWGLIIYGGVAFLKWLMDENKNGGGREKSALEILKRRYAKGEINKKEFAEKKKDLQ
jgi:putative membrane protein